MALSVLSFPPFPGILPAPEMWTSRATKVLKFLSGGGEEPTKRKK